MQNVYELSQQFRASLLARDDATRARMLRSYWGIYRRLLANLTKLTAQIDAARDAGEIFSPSWLFRQERYQELLKQVGAEMKAIEPAVAAEIERRQAEEIARGARDALGLMDASASNAGVSASFSRLPVTALESLVGTLGDGSPLMERLAALRPAAQEAVRDALIEGLAEGAGGRKMAARMRDALGGNADRALLIARTESMRAYSEAQRASYQANADILEPVYEWVSSKSLRTCAACLALDGKLFPVDQPMPRHPNCRCTTICHVKGAPPLSRKTGAEWFAEQADGVKAQIVGKGGLELLKNGATLADFQGERVSRKWGTMTFQRSLRQIAAGEDAPTWTRGQKPKIKETGKAQGSTGFLTEEEFRSMPNYIGSNHPDYPMASNGRMPGHMSLVRELQSPANREMLAEMSIEDGENRLESYLGGPENRMEFQRILDDPRFVLKEPIQLASGITKSAWDSIQKRSQEGTFTIPASKYMGLSIERVARYAGDDGIILNVRAPKGSRVVMADVFDLPEAVIMPGSRYRVIRQFEKEINVDGIMKRHTIVDVEMIEDGSDFISQVLEEATAIDQKMNKP